MDQWAKRRGDTLDRSFSFRASSEDYRALQDLLPGKNASDIGRELVFFYLRNTENGRERALREMRRDLEDLEDRRKSTIKELERKIEDLREQIDSLEAAPMIDPTSHLTDTPLRNPHTEKEIDRLWPLYRQQHQDIKTRPHWDPEDKEIYQWWVDHGYRFTYGDVLKLWDHYEEVPEENKDPAGVSPNSISNNGSRENPIKDAIKGRGPGTEHLDWCSPSVVVDDGVKELELPNGNITETDSGFRIIGQGE